MRIEGNKNTNSVFEMPMMNRTVDHASTSNFETMLNPKVETNKVQDMIVDIEQAKEDLESNLTLKNLTQYRESVKAFLLYYSKNITELEHVIVQEKKGLIKKKLSILKAIDSNINKLTNNMLKTHKEHLEALKNIGEIQGLIVNLFV